MNNDEWLKRQCNKYVNGYCSTLGCLKRGGYKGRGIVYYDRATCKADEILSELKSLRQRVEVSNK